MPWFDNSSRPQQADHALLSAYQLAENETQEQLHPAGVFTWQLCAPKSTPRLLLYNALHNNHTYPLVYCANLEILRF